MCEIQMMKSHELKRSPRGAWQVSPRRSLVVLVTLLLAGLAQSRTKPRVFDLSKEFSSTQNPNQVWQYGYSAEPSLDPAEFRLDASHDEKVPIGFWHPANSQGPGPGYYPYVAYNRSTKTEYGSSNGWAARAGQVAMEGSNTGQYSIVRFTAPSKGTYEIKAQFEGIHFGLSTTDVHVTHNGESLFAGEIAGYGGDPAFHKVEGSSTTVAYTGRVSLKKHDTLDFAGLFATIERD
jgi:hypothetical protein